MSPSVIDVVLVEDHRLFRDGIRALLDPVDDIRVVGEVGDLAELAAFAPDDPDPHVVVTDLMLPDGADSVVVNAVTSRFPDAHVLVLSMLDDLDTVESMLRSGASGYLLKDVASTELLVAIRTVARHGAYLQPSLGVALARRRQHGDDLLTERERDVLRLIALGHTNNEIADLLRRSLRTIESARASIGDKTGARSRTELVRFALDHGMVPGARRR